MSAKCFSNQSVALKVINDGGVYVNHKKLSNPHAILVFGVHILPNMITVLRVGERKEKILINKKSISLFYRKEKFLYDSMDKYRYFIVIFFFLFFIYSVLFF
jgi:hypothetical protein